MEWDRQNHNTQPGSGTMYICNASCETWHWLILSNLHWSRTDIWWIGPISDQSKQWWFGRKSGNWFLQWCMKNHTMEPAWNA